MASNLPFLDTLKFQTWEPKKICGVYLLIHKGVVLYVGQSENIWYRVGQHLCNKKIHFSSVKYAEVAPLLLDAVEKQLIFEFLPAHNHTHCYKKRWQRDCEARETATSKKRSASNALIKDSLPYPKQGRKFADIPQFGTTPMKFERHSISSLSVRG